MYVRALLVLFFFAMVAGDVNGEEAIWQQLSYGKIPINAVPGGEPNTFICRDLNGVPGRLANGKCYATWNGKEYSNDHYEGLSMTPGTYSWVWYKGFLPDGAIKGGSQGTGKDVYICRSPGKEDYVSNATLNKNSIGGTLGKMNTKSRNGKFAPWTSTCYIGDQGFELRAKEFLVLVDKPPVEKPASGIAGAKKVGEDKKQLEPNPLLKSVPLQGAKMMTGTAVAIAPGTTLPQADNATIATLARTSSTLPKYIDTKMSGEGITGLSLVSMEKGKLNLQVSYAFSSSRPQPVYAGAFVYDSSGVTVNVGYIPATVANAQGSMALTLMFPDADIAARYIAVFMMESGKQPFMNEHFDFAYNWQNGQLLTTGPAPGSMGSTSPSRPDLCSAYANRAVEMHTLAIQRKLPGILLPVWSSDYSQHYEWCLKADEKEIYSGHQLRVGYLEQMLPSEFSGKNVALPGEAHALDPGLGP